MPLIFRLSLFGLAMAIGTVFFIPSNIEPLFWLAIFIACAWIMARAGVRHPFRDGLLIGIMNSVWVTGAHVLFATQYLAGHAREAAMIQGSPLGPRTMMLMTGPVVGVLSGAVLGLFALAARALMGRRAPQTADAG